MLHAQLDILRPPSAKLALALGPRGSACRRGVRMSQPLDVNDRFGEYCSMEHSILAGSLFGKYIHLTFQDISIWGAGFYLRAWYRVQVDVDDTVAGDCVVPGPGGSIYCPPGLHPSI